MKIGYILYVTILKEMQSAIATLEQAIHYTLDENLKEILKGCIKKKWPSQFKISNGKVMTAKGNIYDFPKDPMAACNLIHDIISGQEIQVQQVPICISQRENTSSRISGLVDISDDSIFSFAKRETKRLNRSNYYLEELLSCIHSSIMINHISGKDFKFKGKNIISISGIDTSGPFIIERK